ncbi:hypothetical protein ACFLQU_05875, partial [Verrucomicrobiota bacterium]
VLDEPAEFEAGKLYRSTFVGTERKPSLWRPGEEYIRLFFEVDDGTGKTARMGFNTKNAKPDTLRKVAGVMLPELANAPKGSFKTCLGRQVAGRVEYHSLKRGKTPTVDEILPIGALEQSANK